MSYYTLFVDESGDFETQRGEWVVGGALFDSDSKTVLEKLNSVLSPLIDKFDLASKKEFHLTEFRREVGDKEAIERAETLFSAVRETSLNFHLFCVVNERKDSLSTPERTYRAMLTDLLAMLDSVIPHLDEIKQLELVVATRTIDGVRTTAFHDIITDTIKVLPKFFEYDLVSSGFLHLLHKQRIVVTQDNAVRNWGLICADFISNITYHRRKTAEMALLATLNSQNIYSCFVAFGNHQERRARIAERNGDVVLAVGRWLHMYIGAPEEKKGEIKQEIVNLLNKLNYRSFGSSGYELGLASIVDRVWRQTANERDTLKCLRVIKQCILAQQGTNYDMVSVLEVFHIRNLTLMLFNQAANVETAKLIMESQRQATKKLLVLPEFLNHYLEFWRISTEILINDLDFNGALQAADRYNILVDNFCQLMPTVSDDTVDLGLAEKSEIWLTKESFILRILLLSEDLTNPERAEAVGARLNRLVEAAPENLQTRVSCYMLHYLLKTGQINRAMDCLLENVNRPVVGAYLLFWSLMTRNEYVSIHPQDDKVKTVSDFINLHLSALQPNDTALPNSLIWREYSRWEWISNGDKTKALALIEQAQDTLKLSPSNLTSLLADMNKFYQDCIGQEAEKYLSKKDRFICK